MSNNKKVKCCAVKSLALLLSSLMAAVSFTACGDSGDSDGGSSSGPDKIVKKWAEAAISPNGAEDYFTCSIPDEYIKTLKDEGEWDDMIDTYNDNIADELNDGISYRIDSVKKGDELTEEEIKGAEFYLSRNCDEEITVTEGYWYEVKATRSNDEEDDTQKGTVAAVKLPEDGWKVIQRDSEELLYYYDSYSEDTSED